MKTRGLRSRKIAWPAWHFSRVRLFFLLGFLLPIVINLLTVHFFVEPLKKKVAGLSELAALVELKPRMETLIAGSNELMAQKVAKGQPPTDAGSVLKEIRGLARSHKVEIKELRVQNTENAKGVAPDKALEAAGLKKVALSMDITGSYSKVARWLASLDQKMEIRVDDLTLTPSSAGGCQLRLELKLLLRKS